MDQAPINFDDATTIRIPVKLEGKWYALCEANETASRNFQNSTMSGMDMDLSNVDMTTPETIKKSLKQGIKNVNLGKMADSRSVLVSGCLFNCDYDEQANKIIMVKDLVGKDFVDGLPTRVITGLFAKVREISELDKAPKENPTQSEEQSVTKT